MTAAKTRDFLRARFGTLVPLACAIVFGVIAGGATAGNPPPNGCKPSGNKPKKCNPAPAPAAPVPLPPAPAPAPPAPAPAPPAAPPAPQPAPAPLAPAPASPAPAPEPSPGPPPPAPPIAGSGATPDDGTTRTNAPTEDDPAAPADPSGGDPASGSDTSPTGGDTATTPAPQDTSAAPAASSTPLEHSAAPSNSALSAVESSFRPVISVVRPAVAPESSSVTPAAAPVSVDFGAPTFVTASTAALASERILRHWFSPHALVLLARDVMPGVHAIRAKVTGHAQTFALDFGRPISTTGARPFRAGGWLRSDATGVTVCIRALETYKHHTVRSSETCSVAHRNWHRVALRGRAVAKGHRLVVSVYELGASPGDSFDVGGFRVG